MNRTELNFASAVSEKFVFLEEVGFSKIESLPTIVRYRKGDLEIDIYHGRQSYEIGFGIAYEGIRYPLSAIIRVTDPELDKQYRNYTARTPTAIEEGLRLLANVVKRYGERALRGDAEFITALESGRELWLDEVCARQLRPEAAAAFQRGDYRKAAELYEQFRSNLTPAEVKKLAVAKRRAELP